MERQAQVVVKFAIDGFVESEGSNWKGPVPRRSVPVAVDGNDDAPAGDRDSLSGVSTGTPLELGEFQEVAFSPGDVWCSHG